MRKPILPGTTDPDQLEKIWALCGTPNQHTWPNHDDLPGCEGIKRFSTTYSRKLKTSYDAYVSYLSTVRGLVLIVSLWVGSELRHAIYWIKCSLVIHETE